ncbi:zinc finger BED domain-containing protein 1-like [Aphis craccivora]|uniref:Zinc finger BED domain-containing protein 1-like n=1 Tax=Aphis craccivora TaxID=307492 RepID=A0A6G0YFB6_APHCR|nr:zinc finger BED domain-containing protein 1-like [Aphis craccivora]
MDSSILLSAGGDMPAVNESNSEIIDDLQLSTSIYLSPTRQQSSSVATKYLTIFKPLDKRQSSIENFIQKPMPVNKSKMIDQQLLKMICCRGCRISKSYKNVMSKLLNSIKENSYSSLMPQLFNMTVECVKDTLNNVSAVCLTTDGWTSRNNQSFLSVTAHFIDPKNQTQISSVLLGCNSFDETNTSDNLSRFLRNTLDEWNLCHKFTAVVTDNASNIISAIKKCNWRWLPCFAHSINLIVQSSLKCIEPILTKVKFFKKSSHALAKLNGFQKQLGLPVLKLKQDCPMRWNSTYDIIDNFNQRPNYCHSCSSSPQEWIILENVRIILKIFYEITIEISAEKYVTLSKEIYFFLKH